MTKRQGRGRFLATATTASPVPSPVADFWQPGKPYLIRTVTMIDTGILVAVNEHEIILKDAAWIADTGRFHKAIKDQSQFSEVEPYPDGLVLIGRGAIVDAVQIAVAVRDVK